MALFASIFMDSTAPDAPNFRLPPGVESFSDLELLNAAPSSSPAQIFGSAGPLLANFSEPAYSAENNISSPTLAPPLAADLRERLFIYALQQAQQMSAGQLPGNGQGLPDGAQFQISLPQLDTSELLGLQSGVSTPQSTPRSNGHGRVGPGNNPLYKTELCRSWEEFGSCRYGVKCQFAHGREELRPLQRHPKYKTEVCRTFATTGTCPYGTRCRFVHQSPALAQLRIATTGGSSTPSPKHAAASGATSPFSRAPPSATAAAAASPAVQPDELAPALAALLSPRPQSRSYGNLAGLGGSGALFDPSTARTASPAVAQPSHGAVSAAAAFLGTQGLTPSAAAEVLYHSHSTGKLQAHLQGQREPFQGQAFLPPPPPLLLIGTNHFRDEPATPQPSHIAALQVRRSGSDEALTTPTGQAQSPPPSSTHRLQIFANLADPENP